MAPAFSLLTTSPTYQPLLHGFRNDHSDDKSATKDLWAILLPLIFPENENYKIDMYEELNVACTVIEVSDCSPHPKTHAKCEELLLAIHVWNRGAEGDFWRKEQIERYWKTRGRSVKHPDSVSIYEEQWTLGSGLRRRDKITRQETFGVYWINTQVLDIDVREEGSQNGEFGLERQFVKVDRFLDMIKHKKRAWAFENVDWVYEGVN